MGEPDIVVAHWAMSVHKLLDRYPRYSFARLEHSIDDTGYPLHA
jgi:hypothetical protein